MYTHVVHKQTNKQHKKNRDIGYPNRRKKKRSIFLFYSSSCGMYNVIYIKKKKGVKAYIYIFLSSVVIIVVIV